MDRKKNKIIYIGKYNKKTLPGVHNKIEGILSAARDFGYRTENIQEKHYKLLTIKNYISVLLRKNANHIFIRSIGWANILLFPFLLIARTQGKKLIMDMQTPRKDSFHEAIVNKKKKWKRALYKFLHYSSGPWALWPVNKIIQYGNESRYFMFGNRNKTIKIGNGIDANTYKLRKKKYLSQNNKLNLIGVANVSYYHGYDRIIKAIYSWHNKKEKKFDISFSIAGDGPEIDNLKTLTNSLNLKDNIHFLGIKYKNELYDLFSFSHIAVSSIGLHRRKSTEAADLKTREYCLAGIPFIASGNDPDFKDDVPFRMVISADESINDIINIFDNYHEIKKQFSDEDIRKYAINNLTFHSKLKKIGFNPII